MWCCYAGCRVYAWSTSPWSMVPFPLIHDLPALWQRGTVLSEVLAVPPLPAGTPHTAPGPSSRGKAAAEQARAEGPEGGMKISQGWLWWWWWFRLEPAHSWSSTGPGDGKHIWWQWHGMGGQHYGLRLCLPQVQLGRWGSLVCFLRSLLLWLLSPKPTLMFSSVYPSISHTVYFLCFSHALLARRAWSIWQDSRSLNVAESAS